MTASFVKELKKLWVFWTTFMFIINYLLFLAGLNYVPTPEGAIDYTTKIFVYLMQNVLISTVEGALISLITTPIKRFLKEIGLW